MKGKMFGHRAHILYLSPKHTRTASEFIAVIGPKQGRSLAPKAKQQQGKKST